MIKTDQNIAKFSNWIIKVDIYKTQILTHIVCYFFIILLNLLSLIQIFIVGPKIFSPKQCYITPPTQLEQITENFLFLSFILLRNKIPKYCSQRSI